MWTATHAPGEVLPRIIALLVVSCPCALGMATPLAFSIGVGRAARRGIFVRHDGVFETLTAVDTLILDKTGTLTLGTPRIVDVDGDDNVLRLAAAAERRSAHPIAAAFAAFDDGTPSEQFEDLDGRGVRATIEGHVVDVRGAEDATCDQTVIDVFVDGTRRARVTIGDPVRPGARAFVQRWVDRGVDVWIASGDHAGVVERVAREVGVAPERALSGQTPETKEALVGDLQRGGRVAAMVGDGVNDAGALRTADVGIAMFGGAEINAVAGDVQLGRAGLSPIDELHGIGADALRAVRRNLSLSALYNTLALAAAAAGLVTPLVAAVAMPTSSIAVVISSLWQGRRAADAYPRPATAPAWEGATR